MIKTFNPIREPKYVFGNVTTGERIFEIIKDDLNEVICFSEWKISSCIVFLCLKVDKLNSPI